MTAQQPDYLLITQHELDSISAALADEYDTDELRMPAFDAIKSAEARLANASQRLKR